MTLNAHERRALLTALLLLPALDAALRRFGLRRTYAVLIKSSARSVGRGINGAHSVAGRASAADCARSYARAVAIAARHGVCRATCLRQSLALWWLLRRNGITAELRIGVGREAGKIRGHAWVEVGGQVFNDRASVSDDYAVHRDLHRRLLRLGSMGE